MIITALLYFIAMLAIFYLLAVVCDRYFVWSLEIMSKKLGLSDDVAGATLMAIWSSAPEFFTAAMALLAVWAESIGAWTIIWSAIFNILIIVGWSAMMKNAILSKKPMWRDTLIYLISIIILYVTFKDGVITLWESISYVVIYAIYIIILSQWNKFFPHTIDNHVEHIAEDIKHEEEILEKKLWVIGKTMQWIDSIFDKLFPNLDKKPWLYWLTFSISILLIIILSKWLVESWLWFATVLGIPPVIIALTILAWWTSIPDLLSSLIVAKKGKADMAVSNAVWSNIFDILICLWLPWLVYILRTWESVHVWTEWLTESVLILFWIMIMMSAYMIFNKYRINKTYGIMLVSIYIVYLSYQMYLAL